MSTIMLKNNRIDKGELALVYCDYWRTWSRLLYSYNGVYVEVSLSPVNTRKALNWKKIENANIRLHCTRPDPRDKRLLSVQRGSIGYRMMIQAIEPHLLPETIEYLLYYDFLPEIDWGKYSKYNNGGCFFNDCKS